MRNWKNLKRKLQQQLHELCFLHYDSKEVDQYYLMSVLNKSYLLCSCVALILAPLSITAESLPFAAKKDAKKEDGFTINYNTISIIEYIRFASKICNKNFLFNDEDLNFTVTIISDEPATAQSVMTTLVQILRINGLLLLEQDNNLVIHKSPEVKQIAKLVTDQAQEGNAAIVTRIFRVKKANPVSLAAILRPMISESAMLEISPETRQLILTDVTGNVDKVALLIENLDSPVNQIEIKDYVAQFNTPEYLIQLGSQIMHPLSQGDPFILVPATLSNQIFIVSTPELSDKTLSVLKNLDQPPSKQVLAQRKLKGENIFVYKVLNAQGSNIIKGLQNIAKNLEASGSPDPDLIQTIQSARWISETNSILIIGSSESILKAKEFLSALDVSGKGASEQTSFFIYKPVNRSAKEIKEAIEQMASNLKGSKGADPAILETMQNAAINSATNTLTFSGEEKNFARVKELLETIDVPTGKSLKPTEKNIFFIYKVQSSNPSQVQTSLRSFANNLDKSNASDEGLIDTIDEMKYIKESHSILFTGPPEALQRIKEILPTFDSAVTSASPISSQFFIYKPKHQKGEQLVTSLKDISENLESNQLADPGMLQTLRSMKWIKSTNSLLFTGDKASIQRLEEMLPTIDVQANVPIKAPHEEMGFILYSLQYASKDKTEGYLAQVAGSLNKENDQDLIETLRSAKWIEPSHSFLFQGSQKSLGKIQELLKAFDVQKQGAPPEQPVNFYLYSVKNGSKERANQYLKEISDSLSDKGGDTQLIRAINSRRWIEESKSYMFNGQEAELTKIKELLASFDVHKQKALPEKPLNFYLYSIKHGSKDRVNQYLKEVSESLAEKGGDPELIRAIDSRRWIDESKSYMFNGQQEALDKLKEILTSYEQEPATKPSKPGYFIYKLQHATPGVVEDDLDNLSKSFKSSGLKETKVLDVIENMRSIKETNSILLTGDPQAIEEVKALIADYDFPRTNTKIAQNSFFMYKPQNLSSSQIEKSLKEVGNNLKKAGLADPDLLNAIESSKYIDSTNSLIFTGTPEALSKVQALVKDIDIASTVKHSPIQHIGKTTFLLYKIKNAESSNLISSLKSIGSDLRKSGSTDKEFLTALGSMKYIKDTHSLLFTGEEPALLRVQSLVEKFDLPTASAPAPLKPLQEGPSNFFVYKPQSLSGDELEKLMQDFAENLKMTGLSDPALFDTINSMRWVEKSQSLIFTGSEKSLAQIKELLKEFDIPSNLPEGVPTGGSLEPSIQAIDNTSFLVYKLQFHKGIEIQAALRQIAKDLILTNAQINQGLLNSINSIQWLEVTNSLLCSGDQETLTRLKELIKNLDIPLKQVFIEMLVIQTSLSKTLTFGLEWGAKYNYRNKFSGSVNNIPPPSPTSSSALDPFATALNNFTPPGTLAPQTMIPFQNGFDLGVIGQVIKHNGTTYLDLGSLLSALQTDEETMIVMTPKIITQDGRTSTLFSGQNIPFAGSFVSNTNANTTGTTNIEYRDVGVNLSITPVLGNSNIVTLDITLNQTSVPSDASQNQITFSAGGIPSSINGITSSKINMQTTVHVPDNNFLILSGMINNNNDKQKSAIPCLGGLPGIGSAFSKDQNISTNTNLVIFLRPHILSSMDDLQKITTAQEEFFRDNMSVPGLIQQYDEALEMSQPMDEDE